MTEGCVKSDTNLSTKPYQQRVQEWLNACFPHQVRPDGRERTHRFLEEALELAQANGCSREDAIALVNYVYGRPLGDPKSEVGGVMVTLAALCGVAGISMDEAGDRELKRNWTRLDIIRRKQATKPPGSPLPE
jgi:NTP pyrophosphatase (non-canonical NTP hydrolase)